MSGATFRQVPPRHLVLQNIDKVYDIVDKMAADVPTKYWVPLPAAATRSGGQPTASAIAGAPISVSQHPRLPQWQSLPSGVNGR